MPPDSQHMRYYCPLPQQCLLAGTEETERQADGCMEGLVLPITNTIPHEKARAAAMSDP